MLILIRACVRRNLNNKTPIVCWSCYATLRRWYIFYSVAAIENWPTYTLLYFNSNLIRIYSVWYSYAKCQKVSNRVLDNWVTLTQTFIITMFTQFWVIIHDVYSPLSICICQKFSTAILSVSEEQLVSLFIRWLAVSIWSVIKSIIS